MIATMRRHALVVRDVTLALALTMAPAYAQQPLNPPLRNWPAPLYWAPQPREVEHQPVLSRGPSLSAVAQPAGVFTPPGPLTFVAMTPCRVMDTRAGQGFTGAFGPPTLTAYVSRQVPMVSSSCNTPLNAGAYSLNITAVPATVLSFLTAWPAGQVYPNVSTLNAPLGGAVANAAIVVAGTGGAIQLVGGNPTDVIIDINGYYAAPTDTQGNVGIGTAVLTNNTTGIENTGFGYDVLTANTTGRDDTAAGYLALYSNTTGGDNTANGGVALYANTTGSDNTASGAFALGANTTGNDNTAGGSGALLRNTIGGFNTASGAAALENNISGSNNVANGYQALWSNTASNNTASGYRALQLSTTGGANTAVGSTALQNNTVGSDNTASGYGALQNNINANNNTATGAFTLSSNTTGIQNTASGSNALVNNTTGSNNVALGFLAGSAVSGGNSNNIHISNSGLAGDNGAIRIGSGGTQTSLFVAGVRGVVTGIGNAVPVMIDSGGQLGTISSSRRFKEDIQDMGDASSGLLRLRPVTFRYKQAYEDGSKPIDYGLIAEEVAQVYPDLAVRGADGQIETVQYQKLTPMLLNEVQKQAAQIQKEVEQNRRQTDRIRSLEERLAALEALLPSSREPVR